MTDPAAGNAPVVIVKRRRSRRHRRNRLIRRWLTAVTVAFFAVVLSAVALQYLSPSWFRGRESASDFRQAEMRRSRDKVLNEILSQPEPPAARPVYPYSVVRGGVEDAKELKWYADHDPVVGAHYAGFDYRNARVVRLTLARTAYVSYRIGNNIYWMRHRITLHKGETLITDGRMTARTRCANRVEEMPQQEASPVEPPVAKFDEPIMPAIGTAQQTPPVPFQSALLNRPAIGDAAGPLSLYDPFVGGGWISIAPPPIPEGLCGPLKKKGTGESESSGGSNGKKKTGACGTGPTGVVPEPSTWVMLVSGLAAIYWQARRKLARE